MKYKNKLGGIFLSICLFLLALPLTTQAASGSISISSKSGNVGSTVAITCTVRCSSGAIGLADVVLVYDQSSLQYVSGTGGYSLTGGSGSVVYHGLTQDGTSKALSFTVNFKILKAGAHKVSVSSADAYDINEVQFAPGGASGTITGKTQTTNNNNNNSNNNSSNNNNNNTTQNTKDSNNKLNSLQVYPGTLSPAFNANTTSYNVTVPADTTNVTISATAQSSKAAVTVSGGKDLKLGTNTAQVVIVAENGSSRAYTITIMCGEEEKISIGGTQHTINENFTDDKIPTGFARTKLTYNGRQYEGLTNANSNVQLLYLQNQVGPIFYIYNQETQEFFHFLQIPIAEGKYIIPMPLSDSVKGFANADTISLTIQERSFDAWKLDDEFSVLRVINQNGAEALYRYDSVDGVFQRYTEATIEVDEGDAKKALFPNTYYMYAIIGLGALVIILTISMIYFIASRKHRHEGRKRRVIKNHEKQLAREEKMRLKEEQALEKQRIAEEKAAAKQKK